MTFSALWDKEFLADKNDIPFTDQKFSLVTIYTLNYTKNLPISEELWTLGQNVYGFYNLYGPWGSTKGLEATGRIFDPR